MSPATTAAAKLHDGAISETRVHGLMGFSTSLVPEKEDQIPKLPGASACCQSTLLPNCPVPYGQHMISPSRLLSITKKRDLQKTE